MFTVIFSMLYLLVGALFGCAVFLSTAAHNDRRGMGTKKSFGIAMIVGMLATVAWPLFLIVGVVLRAFEGPKEILAVGYHDEKHVNLYANDIVMYDSPTEPLQRIRELNQDKDGPMPRRFGDGMFIRKATVDEITEAFGKNLDAALKYRKDVPRSKHLFGFWLTKMFSPEELASLNVVEKEWGEEKCNEWMHGIMIRSGKFSDAGSGEVRWRTA